MSKITVKHFLNRNLKPYVISGDNYYSIYVLVTANRQNTKFKSILLNEYYNEKDFEELLNSEDKNDRGLISNEVHTITTITELIISFFKSFDTALLAAYFSFSENIFLFDTNCQFIISEEGKIFDSYKHDSNSIGLEMDSIFLHFTSDILSSGVSINSFYNIDNQKKLYEYVNKLPNVKNLKETIFDINLILFIGTLEKFSWFLKGSKKNRTLLDKYQFIFENAQNINILIPENLFLRYSVSVK